MNLYFDVDAGYFVTGPGTRERVDSLSFKRGDTVSIAVRFVSGITVQELGVGAAGKIGLKQEGEYDADFVASDSAWTKTGTGTSAVYTFELNLNTSELNTLLADDGTEGNDVASVELMFEMEYTVGGVTTSSNTITATVHNDVVKGDESGPTLTGGTVPPVNGIITITGTLTSDGSTPVTFPTLTLNGITDGKPSYSGTGSSSLVWSNDNNQWYLSKGAAQWASSDDSMIPDLATFSPIGGATGTPVATSSGFTEGYLGTMKVDSNYLYVVASVTNGIPLWKKIALTAL